MKDRIIVLKITKYSDHHLIVTGLSMKGAKKSFLAPAALKSKKRFGGGVLEPTHFIEIEYTESKSEELLCVLKEAYLIESFENLRTHYDKLQAAFDLLRYTDKVAQEELDNNEALFSLLGHALKALQHAKNPQALVSHFEIKLLSSLGVLEVDESLKAMLTKKFDQYPSQNTLSEKGWQLLNDSKREYLI